MGKTQNLGHLAHIVAYNAENHITVPAGITMHTNQLVASQSYVTTALSSYALSSSLSSYVPTSRTITINGTTFDLSDNRNWDITSMIYPAAGIALSTGSAWGTSITNNSANWNTAFGWGNHASAGYLTGITSAQVTTALGFTPYNSTNPAGYVTASTVLNAVLTPYAVGANTAVTTTDTIETAIEKLQGQVNARVPNARILTINGTPFDLSADRSWTISAGTTLNGTGFVKASGTTITYDNSTYLTGITSALVTGALGFTPYNATNPAGYITGITSANVTTALGFTPYNATNPSGYITSSALTPYLLKSGGTMTGTLTFSSISGAAQTVPNTYGAYLHLGDWAVARTAAGAVLVNTAYRADYATDLFDMNISRFTNNSGYITSSGKADGSLKFWAASHPNDYYLVNNWTGSYWRITSNHPSGVQVAYADSAGNSSTVGGYSVSVAGSANTIPTRNASGYLIPENWIQLNGIYGLYSPTNGAHLYVNNASYGSWRIEGTRNGWHGIHFGGGNGMTLMMNEGEFGFHREGVGWTARFTSGTGYFNISGQAGSISGQANSATINATSGNAGNNIVLRDGNGDIAIGTLNTNHAFFGGGGRGLTSADTYGSYGNVHTYGTGQNGYSGYGARDASGYRSFFMWEAGNGGIYMQDRGKWEIYYFGGNNCTAITGSETYDWVRVCSNGKHRITNDSWCDATSWAYTFSNISDGRLKENIITVDSALDKVLQLRGVYYNWIIDTENKKHIGLIAQETAAVCPEVVNYHDETDTYSVNYSELSGLFVESTKELNQKLMDANARIELLETKLNQLLNA